MRRKELLRKRMVSIVIVLLLWLQLIGSYPLTNITTVNAEGIEPKVIITSHKTGERVNQKIITISGKIQNFVSTDSVSILIGAEQVGITNLVTNNTWSITVDLQEGTNLIYAKALDSDGNSVDSSTIELVVDTTSPPMVTFVSPKEGAFSKNTSIEVLSEPLSTVQICVDCSIDVNGQVTGIWITVPQNSDGKWIYTDSSLADGSHTIYSRGIDSAGNIGSPSRLTFTLDKTRPIVSPNVFPKQDMTQVSISGDATIKVTIIESTSINIQDIDKSIVVTNNGINVPGDTAYNVKTKELTFTPTVPWSRSTKYKVLISPLGLIDSAGNMGFPRMWSFTTENAPPIDVDDKELYKIGYNKLEIQHESPHAIYATNVNTCVNCHNTHEANNPNTLDQKETTKVEGTSFSVDDYCMACHDGTVAAKPENIDSAHKHDAAVSITGKPNGSSCSSCHNPHSDWSEDNPNLAQGHITYTHSEILSTIPDMEKPTGEISSKDQLCESCHESDSADKIAEANGYRLFDYNKSSTAIGLYEDYALCLRCHNPNFKEKYEEIPDIAGFYNYWTEETKKQYDLKNPNSTFIEREISIKEKEFSGHIFKAKDGSPMAGQLPCAECHDTHGSNNIKQLKTSIGHENPKTFEANTGDWDAAKERTFCVTCHNGETAIYGVIGTAIYDKTTGAALDPAKTAHNKVSSVACSKCHSNNDSFIEAAHAPKRLKINP
jgi:predicted CXXCH cytochrome family protein